VIKDSISRDGGGGVSVLRVKYWSYGIVQVKSGAEGPLPVTRIEMQTKFGYQYENRYLSSLHRLAWISITR